MAQNFHLREKLKKNLQHKKTNQKLEILFKGTLPQISSESCPKGQRTIVKDVEHEATIQQLLLPLSIILLSKNSRTKPFWELEFASAPVPQGP